MSNADIKVPEVAEVAEVAEDAVEVRVYQTKCTKKLVNGESKVYITEHRYMPKKKSGLCKTELNKRHAILRSRIKLYLRDLTLTQLEQVDNFCSQINGARPIIE